MERNIVCVEVNNVEEWQVYTKYNNKTTLSFFGHTHHFLFIDVAENTKPNVIQRADKEPQYYNTIKSNTRTPILPT